MSDPGKLAAIFWGGMLVAALGFWLATKLRSPAEQTRDNDT